MSIRFDRLAELATHLETGKLGHEKFNFNIYNDALQPKCGTLGCALGECPILFPYEWKWGNHGDPALIGATQEWNVPEMACLFFGVSDEAEAHLFQPYEQKPWRFGGKLLKDSATRYEVAANIRAFIEKMQEGKI